MTIGLMTMDKKFHWRTPSGTSLITSVILEETCSGTSGLRTVVIAGSRDKHHESVAHTVFQYAHASECKTALARSIPPLSGFKFYIRLNDTRL